ncbi:MAG: hypothetical protein DMD26_12860, partial [Gemmatimonadetes bacterium]
MDLLIEGLTSRTLDHEGATASSPNELAERIDVAPIGVAEQIAEVGLRQGTITQERCRLRGDGVPLVAYRSLAGGQRVRQAHGELASSWVARRLDGSLDEGQLGAAARGGVDGIADGGIDDVRIAATKPGKDGPGDARSSGIVEARIGEREVNESKRTAEAESQPLQIAERNCRDGISVRGNSGDASEHHDRIVVCGSAPHVGRGVATHLRARTKPAERRNDGQQARRDEQRESTVVPENRHHWSVPVPMARVAQIAHVSLLVQHASIVHHAMMRTPFSSTTRLTLIAWALLGTSLRAQARSESMPPTTSARDSAALSVAPRRPEIGSLVLLSFRRSNSPGDSIVSIGGWMAGEPLHFHSDT